MTCRYETTLKKDFSVVCVTKRRLSTAEHTDWSSVINHCISVRRVCWKQGRILREGTYCDWELIFMLRSPVSELTGWTVRSSNLGKRKRLFSSCPERPYRLRDPPILLFCGCQGLFPRLTRSGRKANHLPPYSAEVKNGWIKLTILPFALLMNLVHLSSHLGTGLLPDRLWWNWLTVMTLNTPVFSIYSSCNLSYNHWER
jgi:hypothetical protein